MKTLLPFILIVLLSINAKSQTISCPNDIDVRLIDVPLDKNFGEPTTTAIGNFKIEKSISLNEFECGSDTAYVEKITYDLKINNEKKASCTQQIIIRKLKFSDYTFPDSLIVFDNENISVFDRKYSGEVHPTIKQLAYSPDIRFTVQDSIISFESDIAELKRSWLAVDWCTGKIIKHVQKIKITNKKKLDGVEARTITSEKLNDFYYKIKVSPECINYTNDEPLLIECELLNKNIKQLIFDSIEINNVPVKRNSLDLVFIQRHILGIKKFEKLWQTYAADTNKDSKVTANDLVSLRKNILKLSNELNNKVSVIHYGNKDKPLIDYNNPYGITNIDLSSIIDNKYILVAIPLGDLNGQ